MFALRLAVGSSMSSVEASPEMVRSMIDVAVMKKGIDSQKVQGEAAVKLIEEAGEAVPQPVVARSSELGQMIDVYA